MTSNLSRRRWFEMGATLIGGVAIGAGLTRIGGRQSPPQPQRPKVRAREVMPTMALSLNELQSRIRKRAGRGLDRESAGLGGMTRILGFTRDAMDVILLGTNDEGPTIHIDDLAVAVQSAYRVRLKESGEWQPIGVSIDPRPGAKDPWAIQDVVVLGQPRARMAKRQVILDAELKVVGASLKRLPGVTGAFEAADDLSLCSPLPSAGSEVTSRFWFCSDYPQQSPRFEVEGQAVYVVAPINVQVLTERTKLGGEKTGEADPAAERFAKQVTRLIQAGTRLDYEALVADFRIIEVAELMHHLRIDASLIQVLLNHVPEVIDDIPLYITGIRRKDTSEVACHGTVTVTDRGIEASTPVYMRTLEYRGGVEARVIVRPESVAPAPARVQAEVFRRAIDARPARGPLTWSL